MDKCKYSNFIIVFMLFYPACYCTEILLDHNFSYSEPGWIQCAVIDRPRGYFTEILRDGTPISSECTLMPGYDGDYELLSNCNASSQIFNLTVKQVSEKDCVMWSCRFSVNSEHTNFTEVNVTRTQDPSRNQLKQTDPNEKGSQTNFTCTSTCVNPNATITWIVDDEEEFETDSEYSNDGCTCGSYYVTSFLINITINNEDILCVIDNGLGEPITFTNRVVYIDTLTDDCVEGGNLYGGLTVGFFCLFTGGIILLFFREEIDLWFVFASILSVASIVGEVVCGSLVFAEYSDCVWATVTCAILWVFTVIMSIYAACVLYKKFNNPHELPESNQLGSKSQNVYGESMSSITGLHDLKVPEGTNATFTCRVSGKENVSWSRGQELLQSGKKYMVSHNDSTYSLTVTNCSLEDVGKYRASCGRVSAEAELKVTGETKLCVSQTRNLHDHTVSPNRSKATKHANEGPPTRLLGLPNVVTPETPRDLPPRPKLPPIKSFTYNEMSS